MTEMQRVEVVRGDVRLAVTVCGPEGAPAITFGHSLAADSSMWSPQVDAFQDRYRLVFIDFRGHGSSSTPDGPYRIEELADDVVAVWDALGIGASYYVGVSLGGAVGVALVLAVPDRVKGLLASSCSLEATPPYVAIWEQRAAILKGGGMAAMAEHLMPRWLSEERAAADPAAAARLRQVIEQSPTEGWTSTVAALCNMSFLQRLPDITAPVLLACGSADAVKMMMSSYAGHAPCARYVEIDDGYHILNLDKPEQFNRLIEDLIGNS